MIWICAYPYKTPDDILSSLPSIPASNAPKSAPLILVTPSFAHWLDPSSPFLSQCLGQLYGTSPEANSVLAVAAVVDTLPDTRTISTGAATHESRAASTESEGLSLLVGAETNLHGKAAPPRLIRSSASEDTNLLLSIQTGSPGQTNNRPTHEVGLRLANTVFVNGKETTILGTQWLRDSGSNEYILEQSVDLTSCMVTTTSQSVVTTLDLPLDQVSQRRKVISSMGNILRQVGKSTDPASNEPMPASSELEKELPRYIAEHSIVDQRVSVWALVEKPEVVVADAGSSTHDRLIQSLRQGSKLHRVMSGGGGWGKKQGLLSLDPEVSFSGTANRDELVELPQLFEPENMPTDTLPSFDQGITVDDLSLLSQVASAGDFIQFFVAVEPTYSHSKPSGEASSAEVAVSYHFGMVSDSMEVETHEGSAREKDLVAMPYRFGALSEKAIAYSQPVKGAGSESTKVDIPGSRILLESV
ncbi:uncharacterized protein N7511_010131 [Penicillium nucicola]|uniref:uncharacterized protein n=1 Tax=Penicillium nucicola TaxID=1850975 RepID=UPI00254562F7|nr:uncharacterized protein N7511_010131 [Penicillium nucicola]KAJ5748435.1 hypothetical protein N7511_010131 [Penicillium nucicola]